MTTPKTVVPQGSQIIRAGRREVRATGQLIERCADYWFAHGKEVTDIDKGAQQYYEMLVNETLAEDLKGCTLNQNKEYAFRSWENTKNGWKYQTYIVKVIVEHSWDTIFPDGTRKSFIGLSEVKKLAYPKTPESPAQTIRKAIALIIAKLPEITAVDAPEVETGISNMTVELDKLFPAKQKKAA